MTFHSPEITTEIFPLPFSEFPRTLRTRKDKDRHYYYDYNITNEKFDEQEIRGARYRSLSELELQSQRSTTASLGFVVV